MQTKALLDTSSRGKELQYVTAHFRDLQGLRTVPFWAALLALSGAGISGSFFYPGWYLALAMFAIFLAGFVWFSWCGRWYERRYGTVTNPQPLVGSKFISKMNSILTIAWGGAWFIFGRSNLTTFLVSMFIAYFLIFPRCFFAELEIRPIRFRGILSGVAALALSGIYLSYFFARLEIWPYIAALCTAMLVLNLYDHWLLTRLLNGGAVKASHE